GNGATALEYIFKALEFSQQTGFVEAETTILYQIGVTYRQLANYEKALDYLYKSLLLARSIQYTLMEAYALNVIGSIYFETGEYDKALEYFMPGLTIRQASGDKWGEAGSLDNIGFTYLKLKNYNQASVYCTKSLEITKLTGDKKGQANTLLHLAEAYSKSGFTERSSVCGLESLQLRQLSGDKKGEAEILLFLSDLETQTCDAISGLLQRALKIAEEIKATDLCSKIRLRLYEYYKKEKQFKEAIEQLELHIELEKELHKNTITQKIQNLEISYKAEETKKEAEATQLRNKELIVLNEEIKTQKLKVEATLAELKSAQAQLIQSEKMASLGELTAGIAHEIQNPLNFVNNFSEVNAELIDELTNELNTGNKEEAISIAKDIKENEEKINHHGKRADAIVKGMLQHSRSSSGQKELTDINALAEEYLRLAYHGLRAKDKSFNATMKTDYDESIGNINIIPQDIGRVILNLITNAFYVVDEKKKQQPEGYEPTVSVSTKKLNARPDDPVGRDKIEIRVADNGNGIPQKVLDKIFQPFFTTKPTGQGPGLGLSLSYDIIKAHGGEIKVETIAGEG
ncbi:MAG: tetratricopeptide repeat-containing sensor histidine kinase, partial [Bacteroidia bacterium]